MKMPQFLIVDFEFTFYKKPVGKPRGFFPEIIEVGAVKLDTDANQYVTKFQSFVKPHFYPRQSLDAMNFCMITPKDMAKGIELPEMVNILESIYTPGETYFVGWGAEDYKVLRQGCRRHDINNPIQRDDYLDLALAYKEFAGLERDIGLKRTLEDLGLSFDGIWHTAFDDAQNTGKILRWMLEKGWDPEEFMHRHGRHLQISA